MSAVKYKWKSWSKKNNFEHSMYYIFYILSNLPAIFHCFEWETTSDLSDSFLSSKVMLTSSFEHSETYLTNLTSANEVIQLSLIYE